VSSGDTTPFSAAQLTHEKLLQALHDRDVAAIALHRDDPMFVTLFQEYLNAFARHCSAHLPHDRVEMTRKGCERWRVATQGFGEEIGRTCIKPVDVPTGLWADPALYAAKRELDGLIEADPQRLAGHLLGALSNADTAKRKIAEVQALKSDVGRLLSLNSCGGAGLRRFGEGLRLFALDKLAGEENVASAPIITPPVPGLFRDHNYGRLVDDLIKVQSRTWTMNRYEPDRIGWVDIESRDAAGRVTQLKAAYSYQGFNGSSQGTVTLTFEDGLPACLFFFDAPSVCRTADRGVSATFASGGYAR
jgi:hypothetical protein